MFQGPWKHILVYYIPEVTFPCNREAPWSIPGDLFEEKGVNLAVGSVSPVDHLTTSKYDGEPPGHFWDIFSHFKTQEIEIQGNLYRWHIGFKIYDDSPPP
jgi:hypothetical protein